jgi:4-alpha-glucanotransferase
LGGDFVGTLPLLAAFLDEPFEIGPYSPVSRLFWNEFYLDVTKIPDLAASPRARQLVDSASTRNAIETSRAASLLDYRSIMSAKQPALMELANSFFASSSPRRKNFEKYVVEHPRLKDYAEFRAVGEQFKAAWTEWPEELRNGTLRDGAYSEQSKRYHMYVQWLAEQQLAAAAGKDEGGGLYLDLPLGVNANGYDVWRERDKFAIGVAGGCPPDNVFPRGQNWGFVPLYPHNIRTNGYRYVREYLRHQMRFAKVLRIDHVPSFHRVFWIPPGADARDGVYVRYPAEELYAVFALESQRHRTMLVGEDLGTVPPEVPRSMARHNVQRMYVIEYEAKPDRGAALPEPPASSIASINTHDMAPFAGFWAGIDIEERAAAGLLPTVRRGQEEAERAALRTALTDFLLAENCDGEAEVDATDLFRTCLGFLQNSPARTVLVNLEDLWGETQWQNVPSTGGESANWRRKAGQAWEEFSKDPQILNVLRELISAAAGGSV